YVAAAHNQRNLGAAINQLLEFGRQAFDHFGGNAVVGLSHQGLTAELQQYTFVARLSLAHRMARRCNNMLRRLLTGNDNLPVRQIISTGVKSRPLGAVRAAAADRGFRALQVVFSACALTSAAKSSCFFS